MKRTLTTLALVAMVVVGTGGALAATTANDGSAPQHSDEQQLPNDYTVDVTDRTDAVSDANIEAAIAMAWTNEAVQEGVGDYRQPHFDVVVTGEDTVQVSVAAEAGAEDDIVAKLDLRNDVVTDVFEPTHTASSITTMDLDESDVTIHSAETDSNPVYDEKLTADESMTMQLNPENVTLVEDGETVSWIDADESAQDTIDDENALTPDGDDRITAMSIADTAFEFAL